MFTTLEFFLMAVFSFLLGFAWGAGTAYDENQTLKDEIDELKEEILNLKTTNNE